MSKLPPQCACQFHLGPPSPPPGAHPYCRPLQTQWQVGRVRVQLSLGGWTVKTKNASPSHICGLKRHVSFIYDIGDVCNIDTLKAQCRGGSTSCGAQKGHMSHLPPQTRMSVPSGSTTSTTRGPLKLLASTNSVAGREGQGATRTWRLDSQDRNMHPPSRFLD